MPAPEPARTAVASVVPAASAMTGAAIEATARAPVATSSGAAVAVGAGGTVRVGPTSVGVTVVVTTGAGGTRDDVGEPGEDDGPAAAAPVTSEPTTALDSRTSRCGSVMTTPGAISPAIGPSSVWPRPST